MPPVPPDRRYLWHYRRSHLLICAPVNRSVGTEPEIRWGTPTQSRYPSRHGIPHMRGHAGLSVIAVLRHRTRSFSSERRRPVAKARACCLASHTSPHQVGCWLHMLSCVDSAHAEGETWTTSAPNALLISAHSAEVELQTEKRWRNRPFGAIAGHIAWCCLSIQIGATGRDRSGET